MDNLYVLIKEDIFDEDKTLLISKGELGQLLQVSQKYGYINIKRLKTNSEIEIPYAEGFVQIISEEASKKLSEACKDEFGIDYD